MKSLVSVVIPVYNASNTIVASIQSVVDQTFKDWVLFIINDGSTDNTETVIQEYLSKNIEISSKIQYIKQKNSGVSNARNEGIKRAKGDYIALLDSDDIWQTNKLEIQIKIFNNDNSIDLLSTNRDGLVHGNLPFFKISDLTQITPKVYLFKNFFVTSSLMFKRSIVQKVGYFNEAMSHAEDFEYYIRIIASFNCYLYNKSLVDSTTNKFGYGDSGLSANIKAMERGELKAIKMAHQLKLINYFEWTYISVFSYLKYIRRIIIVAFRN